MERGEIWLVSLDPTAGHEQQGTRPVLIVTPAAFNRVTRLPLRCRWMVLAYVPQVLYVAINPGQLI